VKTDVVRPPRLNARDKKRRPTRLLPRSNFDLVHEDNWLEANRELAFARTHWDHYENLLSHILQQAEKEGRLPQVDSWVLLELFRDGRPAKDGRPSASPDAQFVASTMAGYSYALEFSGNLKTEAAVAAAAKLYGVRRSTVFAARAKISQETLDKWRFKPGRLLAVYEGILEVIAESK
jgi:hypothetical protein